MGFFWGVTSQSTTKVIRRFALVLLLLGSAHSSALGLDDLTVSSAVGERFYGIIKLKNTRSIRPNEVIVSLAPRSVYQRMGVDWEYFHTTLIFDVLEDERGDIYLRIVSSDVLFEPYLDFVLSVRWPSGYLSKQYTVLLEMPVLAPIENRVPAPATVSKPPEPQTTTQSKTPAVTSPVGTPITPPSAPISRPTSVRQAFSKAAALNTITTAVDRSDGVTPSVDQKPLAEIEAAEVKETVLEAILVAETSVEEAIVEEATTAALVSAPVVESEIIEAPATPFVVESSIPEASKPETIAEPMIEAAALTPEVNEEVNIEPKAAIEQDTIVKEETAVVKEAVVKEAVVEKAIFEKAIVEEVLEEQTADVEKGVEAAILGEAILEEVTGEEATVEEAIVEEKVSEIETIVEPELEPEVIAKAVLEAEPSQAWAHTTRTGDYLWRIARKIQAESGGTLKHIVDALYQNNPAAFMGNNANRLKVDARLSVSLAQIRAMSPQANQTLTQNTLDVSANAKSNATAPTTAQYNAEPSQSNKPAGVLSLVAKDNTDNSNISSETLALSERADTVADDNEQQLSATKNRSNKVEQRIDNLYRQYSALSEKTEQLKELEQALNRSIAEKAQANLELEGADSAFLRAGEALSPTGRAPTGQAIQSANDETQTTAAAPTRTQLILTTVLVVLIIVLLIVMLKFQQLRRRAALVENWQLEETFKPRTEHYVSTNTVDKITNSDSSISLDQIDASLAASRKELSEIEQQHAHDYSVDQQTEYIVGQEGAVELEVSVYIAYERYDEAEQLLEQALEKEPDNTVLQSQLLEVYAAKGKQQHFELLAAQIGNKGDVQIDNKIKILRTSI